MNENIVWGIAGVVLGLFLSEPVKDLVQSEDVEQEVLDDLIEEAEAEDVDIEMVDELLTDE